MRALLVLPALGIVGVWGLALAHWPDLPERFPAHFDLRGRPDDWWDRSAVGWFLLPALATVIVLGLGYGLPAWIRSMARADSAMLNVPHRAAFSRLAPERRVAAVAPAGVALPILALEVAVLFGAIVHGSAEVATGARERLPEGVTWTALVLVLATALVAALAGRRAVERAVAVTDE